MSAIDLAILGIILEKAQGAYDIQKDVEAHHFSRWTRISTPSVYRKVRELEEKGYLRSDRIRGERASEKAVYSITEAGRAYFGHLMELHALKEIPIQFDFNVVIANLGRLDRGDALRLIGRLRENIEASRRQCAAYASEYADIPLFGRTIFEQQWMLYEAILDWLDTFEGQLRDEG